MNIIGISGHKQSGKTTASDWILKHYDAVEFTLAKPLKAMIAQFFDVKHCNLYGTDIEKNEILPCGISARQLCQRVGTDWFRSVDPNCWLRYLKQRIDQINRINTKKLIIVPDIRFPNEVKMIHKWGGKVIRLERISKVNDLHVSETILDNYRPFDYMIYNHDMSVEKQNNVLANYFDHYLTQVMDIKKKTSPQRQRERN